MAREGVAQNGRGALATSAEVVHDLLNRHQQTSKMFWRAVALFGVLFILGDIQCRKYAGRVVARVETPDGEDFSRSLLRAGLGRPYDGRRRPWCETPSSQDSR